MSSWHGRAWTARTPCCASARGRLPAGLSLRGLAGIYWLFTKDPGTAFYWLNLGAYTPLCAVLATAAVRVARPVLVEHREDAVRVR